jgi:hypothetical protein
MRLILLLTTNCWVWNKLQSRGAEAWMLGHWQAWSDWRWWLLDGRRESKDFRHAQRSRRSADWLGTSAHEIGQRLSE